MVLLHDLARKNFPRVDFRIVWYAVLIWILAIVTSWFVMLPWFYLAFVLIVFGITAYYFRKVEKTLRAGLWISLLWFFVVFFMDFLEVVAFNFADNVLYISDVRNWLKYILILLVPSIYCLILESIIMRKRSKRPRFFDNLVDQIIPDVIS